MVQSTAARVGLRLPTTDDGQVRLIYLEACLWHLRMLEDARQMASSTVGS